MSMTVVHSEHGRDRLDVAVSDRYLNLALMDIGEAVTKFSMVRNRGGTVGPDFSVIEEFLLRAIAAMKCQPYIPIVAAKHLPQRRVETEPAPSNLEPNNRKTKWRHVAHGSVYAEVCRANLQVSLERPSEHDMLVVYVDDAGTFWAREESEFLDGRFEEISDDSSEQSVEKIVLVSPEDALKRALANLKGTAS